MFQDELTSIISCIPKLVKDDAVESIYLVSSIRDEKDIARMVVSKKEDKFATCLCILFEFKGIPCRHVQAVLKHEMIFTLPKEYFLKRWSRHARKGTNYDKCVVNHMPSSDSSLVAQYANLTYWATMVINEACMSDGTHKHAISILKDLKQMYREMIELQLTRELDSHREGKSVSSAIEIVNHHKLEQRAIQKELNLQKKRCKRNRDFVVDVESAAFHMTSATIRLSCQGNFKI